MANALGSCLPNRLPASPKNVHLNYLSEWFASSDDHPCGPSRVADYAARLTPRRRRPVRIADARTEPENHVCLIGENTMRLRVPSSGERAKGYSMLATHQVGRWPARSSILVLSVTPWLLLPPKLTRASFRQLAVFFCHRLCWSSGPPRVGPLRPLTGVVKTKTN